MFWESIDLAALEDLRLRQRGLVPFIDKRQRNVVYTDFRDEVLGVRKDDVIAVPKMTGVQYEKKVKSYLRAHQDNIVIHKLRANQPPTATDLSQLETLLLQIGEDEGELLLSGLLERSEAPTLVHFVRSLVDMDRATALAAFSDYLGGRSLNAAQMRFIDLVIDQLTARGVIGALLSMRHRSLTCTLVAPMNCSPGGRM